MHASIISGSACVRCRENTDMQNLTAVDAKRKQRVARGCERGSAVSLTCGTANSITPSAVLSSQGRRESRRRRGLGALQGQLDQHTSCAAASGPRSHIAAFIAAFAPQ